MKYLCLCVLLLLASPAFGESPDGPSSDDQKNLTSIESKEGSSSSSSSGSSGSSVESSSQVSSEPSSTQVSSKPSSSQESSESGSSANSSEPISNEESSEPSSSEESSGSSSSSDLSSSNSGSNDTLSSSLDLNDTSDADETIEDTRSDVAAIMNEADLSTSAGVKAVIDVLLNITDIKPSEYEGEIISSDDDLEDLIEDLEDLEESLERKEALEAAVNKANGLYPPEAASSDQLQTFEDALVEVEHAMEKVEEECDDDDDDDDDDEDDEDEDDDKPFEIVINGVSYTRDALKFEIKRIKNLTKAAKHSEAVAAKLSEAQAALGNGKTSAEHSAYSEQLEDLADLLSDDETVRINDSDLNSSQVKALSKSEATLAKSLKAQERLDALSVQISTLELQGIQTSSEANALILLYKDLIDGIKKCKDLSVTINGEKKNKCDIQKRIDELTLKESDLKYKEEVQAAVSAVEESSRQNSGESVERVVVTPGMLEDQVDDLEELAELLDEEDQTVLLNNTEVDSDAISVQIQGIKLEIKQLKDDKLVRLVENGVPSLINENQADIDEKAIEAERLVNSEPLDIDELQELIEILDYILANIGVGSVEINGITYNKESLNTFADTFKVRKAEMDRQADIKSTLEQIIEVAGPSPQYFSPVEGNKMVTLAIHLISILKPEETVDLYGKEYSVSQLQFIVDNIQLAAKNIKPGEVIRITSDGKAINVAARVSNSAALDENSYKSITVAASNLGKSDVVVGSSSSSDEIQSSNPLQKASGTSSTSNSLFLQTLGTITVGDVDREEAFIPTDPLTKGRYASEGETKFILITTFTSGTGTGKVWAFNAEHPHDYKVILEGLDEPSSVCFDPNHNLLYVVDTTAIYQFIISWNDDEVFEIQGSKYVEIYKGSPGDCKVDSYGNLYFTDLSLDVINKASYTDLFYANADEFIELYTARTTINNAVSIDLKGDEEIYYVNNGNALIAGTLNVALTSESKVGLPPITTLWSGDSGPWGVAVTEDSEVYFTTSAGDLKAYDTETDSIITYSSGLLVEPRGICYGDDNVYVTDYSLGILYVTPVGIEGEIDEFIYIQAPSSCFCVNGDSWDEDSATWIAVILGFVVFN